MELKFFQISLLLFNLTFFPSVSKHKLSPDESQALTFHLHQIKPQKQDGTDIPEKKVFSVSGIKPEQSPHAAAVCQEGRPADPLAGPASLVPPPEAAQKNRGARKPARLPSARRVNTGLDLRSAHDLW